MSKEVEHEYTNEVVCPHCGEELMDSWELYEEGEYQCDECGEEYHYERNIIVTYTTRKA